MAGDHDCSELNSGCSVAEASPTMYSEQDTSVSFSDFVMNETVDPNVG